MKSLDEVLMDILLEMEETLKSEIGIGKRLSEVKGIYVGESISQSVKRPSLIIYLGDVEKQGETFKKEEFKVDVLIMSNVAKADLNGYVNSVNYSLRARDILINSETNINELRIKRSGNFYPVSASLVNSKNTTFNSLAVLELVIVAESRK